MKSKIHFATLVLLLVPLQLFNLILFMIIWQVSTTISALLVGASFSAKRKRLAWAILLTSPIFFLPFLSLIDGISDYYDGTANYGKHSGFFAGERRNLDPVYRCYPRNAGCCRTSAEPFFDEPRDFAVHYLTQWFGPMRGAYQGPYPSKLEAFKVIKEKGQTISAAQILSGKFNVDGTSIEFPTKRIDDAIWPLKIEKQDQVSLVLLENQCLIISKVPAPGHEYYNLRDLWQPAVLIDLTKQERFALYEKPPYEIFQQQ